MRARLVVGWLLLVACGGGKPPDPPDPPLPPQPNRVSILVVPKNVGMTVGHSRTFCGFGRYASGAVAMQASIQATCDSIYRNALPGATRVASPEEQLHENGRSCYAWRLTGDSGVLVITASSPCSGTVTVQAVRPGSARVWGEVP